MGSKGSGPAGTEGSGTGGNGGIMEVSGQDSGGSGRDREVVDKGFGRKKWRNERVTFLRAPVIHFSL